MHFCSHVASVQNTGNVTKLVDDKQVTISEAESVATSQPKADTTANYISSRSHTSKYSRTDSISSPSPSLTSASHNSTFIADTISDFGTPNNNSSADMTPSENSFTENNTAANFETQSGSSLTESVDKVSTPTESYFTRSHTSTKLETPIESYFSESFTTANTRTPNDSYSTESNTAIKLVTPSESYTTESNTTAEFGTPSVSNFTGSYPTASDNSISKSPSTTLNGEKTYSSGRSWTPTKSYSSNPNATNILTTSNKTSNKSISSYATEVFSNIASNDDYSSGTDTELLPSDSYLSYSSYDSYSSYLYSSSSYDDYGCT